MFSHINYVLLAMIGGALNTFSLLKFGYTVSHQTGNMTRLVLTNIDHTPDRMYYIAIPLLFVFGAFFAGLVFPYPRRHVSKRYSLSLLFLGLLLIGIHQINLTPFKFLMVLSWMAGFQNSIILYFQGVQIRTTFLSGPLSNFGYLLAQVVKGHLFNLPIVLNQLLIILFYLFGAAVGIQLYHSYYSLAWLSLFYFITAFIFNILAQMAQGVYHE